MAYDDLQLGHSAPPAAPPPRDRPSSTIRLIVVGVLCLAVGALLMLWWMGRTPAEPAPPPPIAATDAPDGSSRPRPQALNLPPLDASDTMLRDLVGVLSRHPMLARLLTTEGLARGATLAVVQIGEGRTPDRPLLVLRPASRVAINGTETGRVDPASYARWNDAVTALASIDPAEFAQLYVNIKPLLDEAYEEQGHPDPDFDEAVVAAINMLAETPVPAEAPQLIRRPDYFIHEDPALRALRPVQKQFLLFGPSNQTRIMDWLRAFAADLALQVR